MAILALLVLQSNFSWGFSLSDDYGDTIESAYPVLDNTTITFLFLTKITQI